VYATKEQTSLDQVVPILGSSNIVPFPLHTAAGNMYVLF